MQGVCLFGVLRRFQHCTGHITTGSWKGRGNQYIEFARVVYCKLPTNGKQLPALPLEPMRGSHPGLRSGRRECYHSATVAPAMQGATGLQFYYFIADPKYVNVFKENTVNAIVFKLQAIN